MTIIYLYRSLAAFGGVERIFIDKANYLAEHYGYHVYIITWEQGGHSIVYPLSPKVTHVDWGILFYRQYQYGLFKRMFMQWKMEKEFFKKLSNFVHTTQADIVIGASCEFTTMAGMDLLQRKTHTILETHSMRTSIEKNINPEKPDVPLNKNDAFQKVQKRRVQENGERGPIQHDQSPPFFFHLNPL